VSLLLAPAAAPAATVKGVYVEDIHFPSSTVAVEDAESERNDIEVTRRNFDFFVRERGRAPLRGSGECRNVEPQLVRCNDYGDTHDFRVRLGGGDDRVRVAMELDQFGDLTVYGEGGDDRLELARRRGQLRGGPGRDVLLGGSGPNRLYGGGGRDILRGRGGRDLLGGDLIAGEPEATAADDAIDGGGGEDFASWSTRAERVEVDLGRGVAGGVGERDTLRSIEGALGGTGDDRLRGGPGPDVLRGGPGADLLNGRDGNDELDGGVAGYSFVGPADESRDRVDCGAGRDLATGVVAHRNPPRPADAVPQSCERWWTDGQRTAVPRLESGSRTLEVEQACKSGGVEAIRRCRRTVVVLSAGEELGRSETATFDDRWTLVVELDRPLERGAPIDLVVEGENQDEDSDAWRNHDHLMRLRWP
jgi:hypothetical protein